MTSRTLTKILLIIFVIILAAIFYVLFIEGSNYGFFGSPASTSTSSSTVIEHPSLTTQNISDTDSINNFEITAAYPQLSGLSSSEAEANINTDIEAQVNTIITNFKTNEESGGTTTSNIFAGATSTLDITASTTIPATISNVITVRLDQEAFPAGAAHPIDTVSTFSYDLSTGSAISLDDLFVGDYLDTLASTTIPILTSQLGSDASPDEISSGAAAVPSNYENFIIEDSGFLVVFNPYQVASYAAGEQDVLLPYSQLTTIINPTGPLKSVQK